MTKIAMGLCLAILITFASPGLVLHAEETPPVNPASGAGGSSSADSQTTLWDLDDWDDDYEEPPGPDYEAARAAYAEILAERDVMALVFMADQYVVRQQPSDAAAEVVTVESGQTVMILDAVLDEDWQPWNKVRLEVGDAAYEGYVYRRNLACSDERFLAWEETYGLNPPQISKRALAYPDIEQFPQNYQASLMALKHAHPNWTFVKMNTNMDFNWVVQQQMADRRSLVHSSLADYMRSAPYGTNGQNWWIASELAVRHYLDPRNWINEEYIFGYEQLTYNASYHNGAGVQSLLNGSFMQGTVPMDSRSYARLFMETGQSLGVSPFHLAVRVYFEQGANGTSPLISGRYPGYEGLYNHFNISASGPTNEAVFQNGLARARKEGWDTPAKAIYGGANIISAGYVRKGQDTLYLQKFNVANGNFAHQYQQNILAPAVEGRKMRDLYASTGALNNTFVFKIPVYNNMPAENCTIPETNYTIALTPPAGYADAKIFLNGVEYPANAQGGQYLVNAGGPHATVATMYKYDANGIPTGMYVWTLSYRSNRTQYTATPQPELENLLTYHGFSIRINGKTGIRCKTGIAADLRARLISGSAAGFWLKECGTVVMNSANLSQQRPLVKGGDRVVGGISYGYYDGKYTDAVYETVAGRHRYTSVLTGLPASQYKTDFAFRGYTILTKEGKDYIIYGPIVSRSIYNLAQSFLASGTYPEGTPANDFLKKLVQDAGG